MFSSIGGMSGEYFSVLHGDLNDIPLADKTGTITGISYVAASFSTSSPKAAELCFYKAYVSTTPLACTRIIPGSSGLVSAFNGQVFEPGISVKINHRVEANGSFYFAEPDRNDSITFHYSTE